jgi:hypothetical protein
MQVFKLFVSSPGDVMVERRRVENVVSRLNGELAGVARLDAIRWETEFYQAFSTFQAQIPPSTDCDLVIGILKYRLGTELPPDFPENCPMVERFRAARPSKSLPPSKNAKKAANCRMSMCSVSPAPRHPSPSKTPIGPGLNVTGTR